MEACIFKSNAIKENKVFSPVFFGLSPEIWGFIFALTAANLHIFTGNFSISLIFLPDAVTAGEWHRIFTHPFVHISWYHMLLDAGAFFLLYTGMEEKRIWVKLLYSAVCGGFSLLFAVWFSPLTRTLGLCGLSGIAHGLMAVSALEMMQNKESFKAGLVSLLAVTGKSIYEIISGKVLFSFLQLGMCGIPVASCHTGGVAGGIIIFLLINSHETNQVEIKKP